MLPERRGKVLLLAERAAQQVDIDIAQMKEVRAEAAAVPLLSIQGSMKLLWRDDSVLQE